MFQRLLALLLNLTYCMSRSIPLILIIVLNIDAVDILRNLSIWYHSSHCIDNMQLPTLIPMF